MTWDPFFDGPGLKIESIVSKGPADQVGSRLRPEEIILEIDGTKVDRRTDLTALLNGPLEREILLNVRSLPGEGVKGGEKSQKKQNSKDREVGSESAGWAGR